MFTTEGRIRSMSGASEEPIGTCASVAPAPVPASWKSGVTGLAPAGAATAMSRVAASAPIAAAARRMVLRDRRIWGGLRSMVAAPGRADAARAPVLRPTALFIPVGGGALGPGQPSHPDPGGTEHAFPDAIAGTD